MSRTNVLILGKSGTGKSTLLNYLWGDKIAETGTGKPVTQKTARGETAIYEYAPIHVNGLDVVIHDSWGMEADKAGIWKEIIANEARKRESSDDINDWFHTLIYCISAKGARIEDFELEIFASLVKEGHTVMFALTKSDVASEEMKQGLRIVIEKECPGVTIVEVGSVSERLRSGRTTEAFGRDAVFKAVQENFQSNLMHKTRAKFVARCNAESRNWKREVLSFYDKTAGHVKPTKWTMDEVAVMADGRFDEMLRSLDAWMNAKNDEAERLLGSFSAGMLRMKMPAGFRVADHSSFFRKGDIEWDAGDYVAGTFMALIPGLNLVYLTVAKEMHRDRLAEKLEQVVSSMENRARQWADTENKNDSETKRLESKLGEAHAKINAILSWGGATPLAVQDGEEKESDADSGCQGIGPWM